MRKYCPRCEDKMISKQAQIAKSKLEKEVIDPEDKEMLEDLVTAAVNQAMQEAQKRAQEEMQKVTGGMLGGMNLPGNLNIPGM